MTSILLVGSALAFAQASPQSRIFVLSSLYCQPFAPPAHGAESSLRISVVPLLLIR